MPAITYDGQSLIVDGRREWLVCAAVNAAGLPREEWAERIADAAQAGFNCILLPCVWSLHEQRRGALDFTGDRDLRAFVQLIKKAGLRCILRPGPFVGDAWDMGGIPVWVGSDARPVKPPKGRSRDDEKKPEWAWGALRSGSPVYLEAASRWISALAEQVRDLQCTAGASNPIVMAQVEHEWFCAHDLGADRHLGEIARFLREGGVNVPLVNCNNMHASSEGEIEGWSASDQLLSIARQLQAVKGDQPAIILETGAPGAAWGRGAIAREPEAVQSMLAQALGGGAQFCDSAFCLGTRFARSGGASSEGAHLFAPPGPVAGAIRAGGLRGREHALVKRLATFASTFGRVFANRDLGQAHAMLAPPRAPGGGVAVAHVAGPRGAADILFAAPDAPPVAELIAPDGSRQTVAFGDQRVAWRLSNTHLHGRATLDHCNLCPFAGVGRVLVCFGPAGARAEASINGAGFEAVVPDGQAPIIEEHEGIVFVLCNEAQIDAAIATEDAVHIGVTRIDPGGNPVAHPDWKQVVRISGAGEVARIGAGGARGAARAARPPSLAGWEVAPCEEYVSGESPRFAATAGPATLDALGAPTGYGWMRARFEPAKPARVKASLLQMADRARVFVDGEGVGGVIGVGPGAADGPFTLALKPAPHTMTILLDNLGRVAGSSTMGEPKGLWGHVEETRPVRTAPPEIETGEPLNPLVHRSPLMGVRESDRTDSRRLTWVLSHRRKTAIALKVDAFAAPAMLLFNEKPLAFLDAPDRPTFILDAPALKPGRNTVQLAFLADHASPSAALESARAMASGLRFVEIVRSITEEAKWAFARWEPPAPAAFEPASKSGPPRAAPGGMPTWWRCAFGTPEGPAPLFLDCAGLTKGRIYLNGRDVCGYWVATASGRAVPPQRRHYLPRAWMSARAPNALMIFDEHGASPAKCRLTFTDDAGE